MDYIIWLLAFSNMAAVMLIVGFNFKNKAYVEAIKGLLEMIVRREQKPPLFPPERAIIDAAIDMVRHTK